MSLERPRRYYLAKRQEAKRWGDPLEAVWLAKQIEQPGTALAVDFPSLSKLADAGYVAVEDVDGATSEELQQAGLSSGEAAAVLAAIEE